LGSSDQWKVPASLSLFQKCEKIPALLYLGKGPEYRPFFPIPTFFTHKSLIKTWMAGTITGEKKKGRPKTNSLQEQKKKKKGES